MSSELETRLACEFGSGPLEARELSWRNPCIASPTMFRRLDPLDVCVSLPGADSSGRVKQIRTPTIDSDLGIGRGDSPKLSCLLATLSLILNISAPLFSFGWQPNLKRML